MSINKDTRKVRLSLDAFLLIPSDRSHLTANLTAEKFLTMKKKTTEQNSKLGH